MLHSLLVAVVPAAVGAFACWFVMRARDLRRQHTEAARPTVTRLEAHMAASQAAPILPSAKSAALRRDVQQVFETKEASQDLEVLDRLLRDIRDITRADEAIFWRWMEERQTLVPSAWSTDGQTRPAFFDVQAWSSLVRWSAEESELQFAGDVSGHPVLASSPVLGPSVVYGVLTVSATAGLQLDRKAAKSWMPRYSAQVASLIQLFDLRRDYALHMRRSDALLDAVQRLHGHRRAEALAEALCETAQEVTSATTAGLVHWNALDQHGMVQAIAPASDIEPGFHVTADTLVGRVCTELLPLILEDAGAATAQHCPYGGLPRPIGSLAIIPILSGDHAIGALVVEGKEAGSVAQHEGRNIGLLAAVARGPLEIIWEIEEVTRRARTDSLTGLANRRHFDEVLRRVIAETDRFGGTCSLIMVDLDHFKQVNDHYGHDAGDTVLRHVALVLGEAIRTVDLCVRYGGEEIAILLPQTSPQGALELAERLRSTLETRPAMRRGEPINVTASFGVATYPVPVPSGEWLLLAADKALYEAKASGRNCVRVIQTSQIAPSLYRSS